MFRYCNLFVTWWINCLVSWLVWLFDLSINRCGDWMINFWVIRRAIHLLVYLTVHWLMWWCGDWLINGLSDWSSDPLTRLLNCSLIYPSMQLITHSFVCSSIDPQNDHSIHGSMFNPIPALPLSSCATNPPPRETTRGDHISQPHFLFAWLLPLALDRIQPCAGQKPWPNVPGNPGPGAPEHLKAGAGWGVGCAPRLY